MSSRGQVKPDCSSYRPWLFHVQHHGGYIHIHYATRPKPATEKSSQSLHEIISARNRWTDLCSTVRGRKIASTPHSVSPWVIVGWPLALQAARPCGIHLVQYCTWWSCNVWACHLVRGPWMYGAQGKRVRGVRRGYKAVPAHRGPQTA